MTDDCPQDVGPHAGLKSNCDRGEITCQENMRMGMIIIDLIKMIKVIELTKIILPFFFVAVICLREGIDCPVVS